MTSSLPAAAGFAFFGHWSLQRGKDVDESRSRTGGFHNHGCTPVPPSFVFWSDMRLKWSYTSAAMRPRLVAYFIFGVRRTHCSRFSANGKRTLKPLLVSYQCFMLTAKKFLSSTKWKIGKIHDGIAREEGWRCSGLPVGSFGKGWFWPMRPRRSPTEGGWDRSKREGRVKHYNWLWGWRMSMNMTKVFYSWIGNTERWRDTSGNGIWEGEQVFIRARGIWRK